MSSQTAKFVADYMKFDVNHENNYGETASCSANYNAAKAVYYWNIRIS